MGAKPEAWFNCPVFMHISSPAFTRVIANDYRFLADLDILSKDN